MKALCPVEIEFGSLATLKALIGDSPRGTIIIAEAFTAGLWGIDGLIKAQARDGRALWIDRVSPNPTQRDVLMALETVGKAEPAEILAIGGGSVLDLAKAVSAFAYFDRGKAWDMQVVTEAIISGAYRQPHRTVDITAVPSTAGTGSEMTQWATIWDARKKAKYSIDDPSLYAKKALIVPELTATLPTALTVSTALDALCHASEAFWARKTTPVVRDIALRAIELIMENLGPALGSPSDLGLRLMLARGALLAGIAFSQTRTTACHSISYPITMRYGVPHGLACAFTLHAVAQANRPVMADADMLFSAYEKHGGLKKWMEAVCGDVLSLRLRDHGIPREDIESIAQEAFTKGRMDNNPVPLGPEAVREILWGIY